MLVEIPNNRKMYNILIGKHNRQDRTQQRCYLLFTTLEPKFNGSYTLRVATAQGKQGIWFLLFPDRENTGNFALT